MHADVDTLECLFMFIPTDKTKKNSIIIINAMQWHWEDICDPSFPRGYNPGLHDALHQEIEPMCGFCHDFNPNADDFPDHPPDGYPNFYDPGNMYLALRVVKWAKNQDDISMVTQFRDWWQRYAYTLIGNNFQEAVLDKIVQYIQGDELEGILEIV